MSPYSTSEKIAAAIRSGTLVQPKSEGARTVRHNPLPACPPPTPPGSAAAVSPLLFSPGRGRQSPRPLCPLPHLERLLPDALSLSLSLTPVSPRRPPWRPSTPVSPFSPQTTPSRCSLPLVYPVSPVPCLTSHASLATLSSFSSPQYSSLRTPHALARDRNSPRRGSRPHPRSATRSASPSPRPSARTCPTRERTQDVTRSCAALPKRNAEELGPEHVSKVPTTSHRTFRNAEELDREKTSKTNLNSSAASSPPYTFNSWLGFSVIAAHVVQTRANTHATTGLRVRPSRSKDTTSSGKKCSSGGNPQGPQSSHTKRHNTTQAYT